MRAKGLQESALGKGGLEKGERVTGPGKSMCKGPGGGRARYILGVERGSLL